MWTMTDYKHSNQLTSHNPTLPDTLNSFFARFDTSDSREAALLPQPQHTLNMLSHSMLEYEEYDFLVQRI